MFSKLLVPLDGSPESAAVLPIARTLAATTDAAITLLRVAPRRGASTDQPAVAEATAALARIAADLGGRAARVDTAVRWGDPAEEILEEARTGGTDLLAMATRGRAGLERAVLGSVSQRVLAGSDCPVVLQRPGGRRVTRLQTLLVPVDGSPGGAAALGTGVGLARSTGARVVLIEVVPPIPLYVGDPFGTPYIDPTWDEEARSTAQEYVDGLADRLRRIGVEAESRAILGDVIRTIVATADEVEADLIVMSTHALTGPARALLGSVADAVVRAADQPVLLVRLRPPVTTEVPSPLVAEVGERDLFAEPADD